MSELVGRILHDRYQVREFLGRGGMAEVYKVWDAHRSTFLAMKVLHQDLALTDDNVRADRIGNTLAGRDIWAYSIGDADNLTLDGLPEPAAHSTSSMPPIAGSSRSSCAGSTTSAACETETFEDTSHSCRPAKSHAA